MVECMGKEIIFKYNLTVQILKVQKDKIVLFIQNEPLRLILRIKLPLRYKHNSGIAVRLGEFDDNDKVKKNEI